MHEAWLVFDRNGQFVRSFIDDPEAANAWAASIAGFVCRIVIARDFRQPDADTPAGRPTMAAMPPAAPTDAGNLPGR